MYVLQVQCKSITQIAILHAHVLRKVDMECVVNTIQYNIYTIQYFLFLKRNLYRGMGEIRLVLPDSYNIGAPST